MTKNNTILITDGTYYRDGRWLEGYIYIKDAFIIETGEGAPPAHLREKAETCLHAKHRAVLPGLRNGHTHLGQTFMRGLAGGRPLLKWLKEKIWPLQAAMTPEDIRLAAELGLIENIKNGITEVTDHHKITATPAHTDAVLEAADESGIKMVLARAWTDKGDKGESVDSILEDLERLNNYSYSSRIRIANGPLAPWRCSPEALKETHRLIRGCGSFTHIHIAEIEKEFSDFQKEYARTPIHWLKETGVMDQHCQLVHSVWVTGEDLNAIALSGAEVIHCPVSNCVLGSGTAPLAGFRKKGIPVALGTDGPASNDNQDIFETMKTALNIVRVGNLDPTLLSPEEVLKMTMVGNSLSTGETADLILLNLNHPGAIPVHDIPSAVVLSSHGNDVETVIVNGKILMHDRVIRFTDEERLYDKCRTAVKALLSRAGI